MAGLLRCRNLSGVWRHGIYYTRPSDDAKFVLFFDEGIPHPFTHIMSRSAYVVVWHQSLLSLKDKNNLIRNALRIMQQLNGLNFEGEIYEAYRRIISQDVCLAPARILTRSRVDMIYNGILAFGQPSTLYAEALSMLALNLVDEIPPAYVLNLRLGSRIDVGSIHDTNWVFGVAAGALGVKSGQSPLAMDNRRRSLRDAVVTASEIRELKIFIVPGQSLLASAVISLGSKWIPLKDDSVLYEHLILILRFGPVLLDKLLFNRDGACLDMWNELLVHGQHYEGGGFAGFRISDPSQEPCLILGIMAASLIYQQYADLDDRVVKVLKQRLKDVERITDDELSMVTLEATCWRLFLELKFNPFAKH